MDNEIDRLSCVLVNPSKKLLSTPTDVKLTASSLRVNTTRIKDGDFFLAAADDSCCKTVKNKMKADLATLSREHNARVHEACAEILRCKARLERGN